MQCRRILATVLALAGTAESGPLISELNHLRADPRAYAAKLQARRAYYNGWRYAPPGETPTQTTEGVRALDQAVRALKTQLPLPPVADSSALARSALEHVRDIGPKGLVSHDGSNGSTPFSRIRRHLASATSIAEVMSFGSKDTESVILDLLVDDGVPDRGHRKILLNPDYREAGDACGKHRLYGTACVIDFAR